MDAVDNATKRIFDWALVLSLLFVIGAIVGYSLHNFAAMVFALALIVIIWLATITIGLFTILGMLHKMNKREIDNHGQARTN